MRVFRFLVMTSVCCVLTGSGAAALAEPAREGEGGSGDPAREGNVLSIESTVVDGLHAEELLCRLSELDLMSGVVLVGSLAERAVEFRACLEPGDRARVFWRFEGGAARGVRVEGAVDEKARSCIQAAMSAVLSVSEGDCSVWLSLGD